MYVELITRLARAKDDIARACRRCQSTLYIVFNIVTIILNKFIPKEKNTCTMKIREHNAQWKGDGKPEGLWIPGNRLLNILFT